MAQKRKSKKKDKAKFSKMIIVALLVTVIVFTVTMVLIFCLTEYHTVPDTLITCFYAFAGSEAGFLGAIKFSDNKYEKKDINGNEVLDGPTQTPDDYDMG